MTFKEISIEERELNPLTKLDKEWALVTAGNRAKSNTMTVSWGGMGVIWNKNVVTVYIRPQRYTKEFIDSQERFTLSFFAPEYKKDLGVLGRTSGRDLDKVAQVGFTPAYLEGDVVTYEQAQLVFSCRKLYADAIKPECFLDGELDVRNYPEHDYHTLYMGEIEHVYQRI